MNDNDSAILIKKEINSFVYKAPRKVGSVWCRGIQGYGGILRELTDDLEMTDKFTISPGQGYEARHGLTFARAYTEHELRLKYNKLPTKGKRVRR